MLVRRSNSLLDHVLDEWNRALATNGQQISLGLALDVHEDENSYTVTADVPGIPAEDISIHLDDNTLTISAETKEEKREGSGQMLVQERRFGKFSRSVRFPVYVNADAIEAAHKDGVLTITVPKAEEVKPRRITIKRSKS